MRRVASVRAKLAAGVSAVLTVRAVVEPYLFARGKIGEDWAVWPDYTRTMIVEQTIAIAIPGCLAFGVGLTLLMRNQAGWLGYGLLVLAPLLSLLAFILLLTFS
jgi:hypothetical protein